MARPGDTGRGPVVDHALVRAHVIAAFVALLVSVTFGIIVAEQLVHPDMAADLPWLSWGRVRYAHTQGIMLGWLGNAFLAFLYHGVPLLTGSRVTSTRLGWWLFGVWNFAVLAPGWLLVLAGVSQPLEWAEFPLPVDAFVVLGLVLAVVQFLPPFFGRGLEQLYVSSWYIIGGLIFTLLAYPMGNVVPELVPGAQGAAFSGLWIHDAVGLFVTPLALAIIYFVIPAASGRPIYSHFLSMLGFWLLFFLYPLNGTHHYVFSVIPMAAQIGAIAASTLLGVDVILVVANLLLSLRGSGLVPRDIGLRFVATSTVFYLVVSIQGSLQAQMAVNQAVHFSDWVIGHSHLAMLGFATFARSRRHRARVAAAARGALQRARTRVGLLAARRRRDADGRGPDARRPRRSACLAVERAVARVGSCGEAVLDRPHALGHSDRSRLHHAARGAHDRRARCGVAGAARRGAGTVARERRRTAAGAGARRRRP